MSTLLTILHVIVCLFLVLTILLQSGKGGGMGAAFGGGNAATVFGGSGASSFLKKLTAGAGTFFMLTSMVLAFLASHSTSDALEKFGEQQAELAKKKDEAREKAMESGSGSAGSGFVLPTGAFGSAAPAKAEAPKAEAPKAEAPKAEAPKTEAPKTPDPLNTIPANR